jgi:hypothetical protein
MHPRRRRLLVASIAALVVGGSAAALAVAFGGDDESSRASSDGIQEGGPLAGTASSSATATSAPVPLGEPYSWGGTPLINDGDEPVTIERIELMELPPEMTVVGMYALAGSEPGIGLRAGYEPAEWPEPAGLTIQPGETYDLVVGAQIEQPGRFLIPGVRIHYRAGETRYQATLNHALRLCGPPEQHARCPSEAQVRY